MLLNIVLVWKRYVYRRLDGIMETWTYRFQYACAIQNITNLEGLFTIIPWKLRVWNTTGRL